MSERADAMTTGKHTPGEWFAGDSGTVYGDGGRVVVAHNIANDADCDLIAAGPELLAVVHKAEQLASVASDWNLYEVEIDGQMVSIYDLMSEFKAAISKAEGSKP